ncbi:MAG: glucan biosynthesis protein [Pseudomonadota bacterium]
MNKTSGINGLEEEIAQVRLTHKFDREWLERYAKSLSARPFEPKELPPDNPLNQLDYDDYKKIQFERGATIWSREPRNFRVNPLHPGFLFKVPVKLNLVVGGISRRILYTTDIFNYDAEQQALKETDAGGYSGFSVTNRINRENKWDEFLVFQGGSYFRAVGQTNWYGLSARGLAVNTAKPTGEEFPVFSEFWIERPDEGAEKLVIHALMESQSVTGAFSFTVTPGEHTVVAVDSILFPRTTIDAFGIAPLTSMFLFSPMDASRFDDFRPRVHDSDGLLIVKQNGERVWRPLANPIRLEVSAFSDINPGGFGLMQRSREFEQYQDIKAHYQYRPSAWIEPVSNFGEGHIELIEIPTDIEIHDNIVAFWQPKRPLEPGFGYEFDYKMHWGSLAPIDRKPGRIVSSASGRTLNSETERDFVIDFEADDIPDNLTIDASSSTGQITGAIQKIIPQNGRLRLVVKFEPGAEDVSELRVSLFNENQPWGETWLYRWTR